MFAEHGQHHMAFMHKEETAIIDGAQPVLHTRSTLIFGHYGTTIGVGTGMVRLVRVDQATVSWLAFLIIWTSAIDSWFKGLVLH